MNHYAKSNAIPSTVLSDPHLPSQYANVAGGQPGAAENSFNPSQGTQGLRRVGFSVGNIHFLLQEGTFCELLVDIAVFPLPYAPNHFCGLINLRGNIIPAYDIGTFIPGSQTNSRFALLIGKQDKGAALLVDDKPKLIDIGSTHHSAASHLHINSKLGDCFDATFVVNGINWHSLDHHKLFSILSRASKLTSDTGKY